MMPKWLNKFLTPEEESQLRDPSKRIFTCGLLASAAMLALPAVPVDTGVYTRFNITMEYEGGVWHTKPENGILYPGAELALAWDNGKREVWVKE